MEDLGSDPSAVGRTIRLNSIPFTIVGVTPRGFQNVAVPFPIYVPTARIDEIGTRARLTDRNARSFSCFLRLPDGPRSPGREAVEARLAVVAENLDREHPLPEDQKRRIAVRGVEGNVEARATGVLMLAGAVGLLLLLACANVANRGGLASRCQHRSSCWSLSPVFITAAEAAKLGVLVSRSPVRRCLPLGPPRHLRSQREDEDTAS